MRSADLTATARIRDAAIEQFGQHGFGVGLRAIAEAAGVSAALVIHHFGSKDGLRKACDDFVAEEIRSSKSEAMRVQRSGHLVVADGRSRVLRAADGLPGAQHADRRGAGKHVVDRMIDNAEAYLEDGVRAGTIKPSRDPHAGPGTWR